MRIIAGVWKGRRLKSVPGMKTRPTSDKVKGAVFNILGAKVEDAAVLDLFAGTGSLSLEALSRGAKSAVMIEKNGPAGETVQENMDLVQAQDKAKVLRLDAFHFLADDHNAYDLIFLDPPYYQGMVHKVLDILKNRNSLKPCGVIVIETASDEALPVDLHPLELMIVKEYGGTKIWFLQQAQTPEEE